MNLDSPREPSRSMSIDIDDNAIPGRHPDTCGRIATDFHLQNQQFAESSQASLQNPSGHPPLDRECLPGSNDSPRLMVLAPSSSSVNCPTELDGIPQNQGLDLGVTSRKRKHSLEGLTHMAVDQDCIPRDAAFVDGAHSQSGRRVRPRRRTQRDREFTPLLIMPSGWGQESLAEETISAFHYPPAADLPGPSDSIQRHFLPGNPSHGGPRSPQSGDDLGNQERGRSDSASSFAELALASTTTSKHGRLSTLSLCLPRPFEDTRSSAGSIRVHERGLEVLPSFPPVGRGRMDGQRASCELVGSPTGTLGCSVRPNAVPPQPALYPLEVGPGSSKYFDKPMCDSPESISPDENYLAHIARVTHGSTCWGPQGSHGGSR